MKTFVYTVMDNVCVCVGVRVNNRNYKSTVQYRILHCLFNCGAAAQSTAVIEKRLIIC